MEPKQEVRVKEPGGAHMWFSLKPFSENAVDCVRSE